MPTYKILDPEKGMMAGGEHDWMPEASFKVYVDQDVARNVNVNGKSSAVIKAQVVGVKLNNFTRSGGVKETVAELILAPLSVKVQSSSPETDFEDLVED
jgi:hypothetical protein